MAFTGNFMTQSFKTELLTGTHNFTNAANVFKIALYTSAATMDATTTVYSSTNECPATGNYSTGGYTLTNVTPTWNTSGGAAAITDFGDALWSAATITSRGALIYNSSATNKSVVVLDFGSDKTSTAGDFTVQFPVAAATTAIIRIA